MSDCTELCKKIFVHSSTCLFSNIVHFLLYLRAFASSVSVLSLFRSFRCWYTLKRLLVYDFWQTSSFPTNTTTTQNPTSVSLTLMHTNVTHSVEHRSYPLRTVRPIYRTGVPLPSRCCILYIFSTNISTDYFKHAAHSPFFSSKCRLFHNATFFGSCTIHILHTGCAKI